MVTFCLGCGQGKSILLRLIVLAAILLLITRPGSAVTILKGQVLDQTASSIVAGAAVEVRRGNSALVVANSDRDGHFSLALDLPVMPQAQNLTLFVKHPDFADSSRPVIVTSGALDSSFYKIELFPLSLTRCQPQHPYAVVVGYFRSPIAEAQEYRNLPSRIAVALTYDLLPRLQEIHVPNTFSRFSLNVVKRCRV